MKKWRKDGAKKGEAAAEVKPVAGDPRAVVVTLEALRALHPRNPVTILTRVVALLLRGLRAQQRISQGELAKRSGVTRQEIGQLELAEHDIRLVTLQCLCTALHTGLGAVVAVAERYAVCGWQV